MNGAEGTRAPNGESCKRSVRQTRVQGPTENTLRTSANNEVARALRLQAQALTAMADVLEATLANGPANHDGDRLLTTHELAAVLRVSVDTVARFAKDGAPFELVGARRRFRERVVRAWLASRPSLRHQREEPILLKRER